MIHRTIAIGRPQGFTLLELTVATAMFAVLGLALYSSMRIGYVARDTARQQTMAPRQAAIALDLLEREFQSVTPPTGMLAGPFFGYAMGSPGSETDSASFHTIDRDMQADDRDPLSEGLRHVVVGLSRESEGYVLVREVQRNLLAPVQRDPQREVLARGINALRIRYYNGLNWQSEWDSTVLGNTLPLAVELTIELDRPSADLESQPYRMTRIVPLTPGRVSQQIIETGGGL